MAAFDERAAAMTEYLQFNVGKDNRQDIEYSGYIKAIKDLLQITVEDVKETE